MSLNFWRMILSVGLIISLSENFAKADVEARFAGVVSKSYLASELLKSQSAEWELKKDVPSFVWQGPMPIQIQKSRVYLKTKIKNLEFLGDSQLALDFQGIKFDFSVDQFAIDTVVQHQVGNTTINVKIKTECKNLNFHYEAEDSGLESLFAISEDLGTLIFRTERLKLHMDPKNWSMSQFECSNIEGIENVISEQIAKNFFNESAPLEKLISNYVESDGGALLSQLVNTQLSKISQLLGEFGPKLKQTLLSIKQSSGHFVAHVMARLTSPRSEVVAPAAINLQTNSLSLFLPKHLIEILIEDSILEQSKKSISSKTIPALDKLTKSRFSQLLMFPALMKLPVGAELTLFPSIQNLKVSLEDNKGTPQFKLSGQSGFWFTYENMPMVFFRSPLAMTADLGANGVKQANVKGFQISVQWAQEFLDKYRPLKWIATSMIGGDLQKVVKEKLTKTVWPSTLKISDVSLKDNTLEISF